MLENMKVKILLALLILPISIQPISVYAGNNYSPEQSADSIKINGAISQAEDKIDDPKLDRKPAKLKNDSPLRKRRENFRRNKGLVGIKDLLEISQPADIDTVRRIYIDIESSPDQSDDDRKKLFVRTVVDEFLEAVDLSGLDLTPEQAAEIDIVNKGIEIKLKQEGSLKLIIRDNLGSKDKPPVAEVRFVKFRVPKYDKVNKLEFVMKNN